MQCDRARMVFDLLCECVCQASEAAHVHPHRQILPLNKRRADMVRVGVASNVPLLCADALCGAIAFLAMRLCAVNFLQHGVVNVIVKHVINGDQIRPVAVTR